MPASWSSICARARSFVASRRCGFPAATARMRRGDREPERAARGRLPHDLNAEGRFPGREAAPQGGRSDCSEISRDDGAARCWRRVRLPVAAEDAKTALKDKTGKDVGTVELSQTRPACCSSSRSRAPAGEHAFHIHAVGRRAALRSAGAHFNPTNQKHGMMSGQGHAGDMPNLHIPASGELRSRWSTRRSRWTRKPRCSTMTAPIVIHQGKDDYKSDPAGNSGTASPAA